MGRVSKEQAGRNRERVVETAAELFRARGVENVSIADIMTQADLTAGGFYKHFPSKEALVAEAFELAFGQSSASWRQTEEGRGAKTGGVEALVRGYFAPHVAKDTCPMLAFAAFAGSSPSATDAVDAYSRGCKALLDQFLNAADAEQGAATATAPSDQMLLLFAAMVGAGMLARGAGATRWVKTVQKAILAESRQMVSGNAVLA
jgi:TetR/AcrR family transcriptional repressor of nem operon